MIGWKDLRQLWLLKTIVVVSAITASGAPSRESGLVIGFPGTGRPPVQLGSGSGPTITNYGSAQAGLTVQFPGTARPPVRLGGSSKIVVHQVAKSRITPRPKAN